MVFPRVCCTTDHSLVFEYNSVWYAFRHAPCHSSELTSADRSSVCTDKHRQAQALYGGSSGVAFVKMKVRHRHDSFSGRSLNLGTVGQR